EELETRLNQTIIYLGDQDEVIQSIGAILQFTKNIYCNISNNSYSPNNLYFPQQNQLVVNSDYQMESTDIDEVDFDDQENTCQFVNPPTNMLNKESNNQ
ncbi:MAG: hypothetical protein F6K62_26255, partial [Sphaerospermopsis sp. SIO1G2]|nr:hypothetical protein [Sphaerospermopsis sp. SIO1G2]